MYSSNLFIDFKVILYLVLSYGLSKIHNLHDIFLHEHLQFFKSWIELSNLILEIPNHFIKSFHLEIISDYLISLALSNNINSF